MSNAWGWLGTITGITGALLVALNINEVFTGYLFFMASAISWVIQGTKNSDKSLVLLNAVFVCVNALGLYNWF
ncbi:MAG: hypothetical protein NZ824_04610 [Candidatus Thioglobus sp.]|nr:hypothetical protein [Candidatus Thioglobus sp.]